jgi:RecA/RadA recombinase
MGSLMDRLRENDKKGLFKPSQTSISYPTGFLPFDFKNGYTVEVMDDNDQVLDTYASVGIRGGTFLTVIGKTGTAKTTFIVQTAFSMVRNFENAFIIYFDLEQVLSYTRLKKLTGCGNKELKEKFILKQEQNYIEDIFDTIMAVGKIKEENKAEYTYDTGLRDELGDPIRTYVPTVVVVDSIPTLASKDTSDAMEGSTLGNRNAKIIAQFYKRLMPLIKKYNITVMAINHINAKIEINPFAKTQAQVMYLKMDESVPSSADRAA